jgi:CBS domain-containing protein
MEPQQSGADRPVSTLTGDAVVEIAGEATLRELASLLVESDVGAAVIAGDGAPAGIVSERDVVRAVARGQDPAQARCADLATTRLIRCDAGARAGDVAALMMEHWVRHVLVEEDGAVIGIVSARDLLGLLAGDAGPDGPEPQGEGEAP